MKKIKMTKTTTLKGELIPPPDKSISHRAVMFASLAKGTSIVRNFLKAEDPVSTMNTFRQLGIEIEEARDTRQGVYELVIKGKGLYGLREPFDVLDCGNSGTTVRLLSGILAGNPFFSVITGDTSLNQRPMARVINPLKEMGAAISGRGADKYLPVAIKGKKLNSIDYLMPVASAQVKSCLLLAGLYADGITTITESQKSRDHTERMLRAMGADIEVDGLIIRVKGQGSKIRELNPIDITVPADFSSAAFFIAAALIVPGSELTLRNICVNPTRTGMLEIIKKMGGIIRLENLKDISGESAADIYCKTPDTLRAIKIEGDIIPSLIDEFPILCILATQAEGVTEIRGAEELRVKESDRIKAMATELKKFGVDVEEYPDGIAIKGKTTLKGCTVESYNDHRIAMAFAIAGLIAEGETIINNSSCVDISFPGFFEELKKLSKGR